MKQNNAASILLLFSIQLQKILDAGRPRYVPESDPTLIPYDIINPDSPPYAKMFRANSLNIKPRPETILISNFPPRREKGLRHPLFNDDTKRYFSALHPARNYKCAPIFRSEHFATSDFRSEPRLENNARFSRKASNAGQYGDDVQDSFRNSEIRVPGIRNRDTSFRGDDFNPSESLLTSKIPGEAGSIDYSIHYFPPVTSFDCDKMPRTPGMYADVETGCQVYHVCYDGAHGKARATFLCANGTLFNQLEFTCDWWYNINCEEAANYYGHRFNDNACVRVVTNESSVLSQFEADPFTNTCDIWTSDYVALHSSTEDGQGMLSYEIFLWLIPFVSSIPVRTGHQNSDIVFIGGFVPIINPAVETQMQPQSVAFATSTPLPPPPIFAGEFPRNPMPHPLVIEVSKQEDSLHPSLKRNYMRNPKLLQVMSFSTLLGPQERIELVRDSDVMPREAVYKMLKFAGFIQ